MLRHFRRSLAGLLVPECRIILPDGAPNDGLGFRSLWTVEKWHSTARKLSGHPPDDVVCFDGNLALNAGITEALELITGEGTPTAYDNANAYLYVGDSTTAAAASQTDLQASTNKLEKGMDSGFPTVSGQVATWKSTYGTSEANFDWEEVGVKNGSGSPSASVIMLNRKVSSLGTKASGSWTLSLAITGS